MNTALLSSLAFLSVCAATAPAEAAPEIPMQPFVVDWPAGTPSLADVSFLLEAPAGKSGFLRVQDGHLVQADGKRIRLWGINATMQAGLPASENAPVVAEQLARRGLNCVRFHFLDRPAPNGLIDATRDDTRALDPKQLDRLDFFIAELKKRGIYADLNLNVGRTYKPGDGVRDFELLGFPKGITYSDERLVELQKEYARQLLTHVNPYTGKAYTQEPAVAIVEFVNENSLLERWLGAQLLGRQTNRATGTWHDIPPSYAEALNTNYDAWLKHKLAPEALARLRAEAGVQAGQPVPRLRPDQFKAASELRFQTEAAFYIEIERGFFQTMSAFLRDQLGLKSLLVGNSDHWHQRSGYGLALGTSLLDIVDGHVYWQHPNYVTDPKTGRTTGFNIPNTAMVDDPLHSTVVQLSRSAVAGKPYTVSEVNHPFPNEFACEGVPILAAYAALQDWDGVFWYTLGHRDVLELEPVVKGHFDFARDPVKMSQLAAGALMFLRGDVRPARRTLGRSYTREQVMESLRLPSSEWPYFTAVFPLALPLIHAMRVSSFDGPPTGSFERPPDGPIRSDTGELTWNFGAKQTGLVTINTPRTQALVGFCGATNAATENLAAEVNTRFCALTLSALDDQPIESSARLLLTTAARVGNTGMEWNARRTSLTSWGASPTTIEPVSGRLVLKHLREPRSISLQPLDGAGRALGPAITAEKTGPGWVLPLGKPASTWFLVSLAR